MTDEEAETLKLLEKLDKVTPGSLRRVDSDTDNFLKTFGDTIQAYAEQHKLEYVLLGKTIVMCYTDKICIKQADKSEDGILGGFVCIGDDEHLIMLYKALGEELKKKGVNVDA